MVKTHVPPIVQDGDPVLRQVAAPVTLDEIGSKALNEILDRMNAALDKEADGVAIAAPQIGVSKRIFIVSRKAFAVDEERKHGEPAPKNEMPDHNLVFINPEIIKVSRKKMTVPEGCLSVRWLYGNTLDEISHTLRNGRNGNMPAQADILTEEKIHILAAYVTSLGKRACASSSPSWATRSYSGVKSGAVASNSCSKESITK